MATAFRDLREWLERVKQWEELRSVSGVDLEEDVGRIAEISGSVEGGPVILLDDFPKYPHGHRILLNPYGSIRRIAFTFGFDVDSCLTRYDLLEQFRRKLPKLEMVPPKLVKDAPIFENKLSGKDVDLMVIPVPKWHPGDGGPYIGTGCLVITQDPDEGWVNVGTYRVQRHDSKTVGSYIAPSHHGRAHRDKYFSQGKPCPTAVVVGCDPLLFSAGMVELPWGISEYGYAGGWRGEPVEVVEAPITKLPIPARAEIVIEGYSYPGKTKTEGPFGEWSGYYASGPIEEPFVEVEGIYFRNNPILFGCPPEKPPYDADKLRQYTKSALLVHQLQELGIPGIKNAWCFGIGSCRMLLAISIKQGYCGHSRQVGHAAYASIAGNFAGRYVIVVDEDIDVTDLNDVVWAVLTRSDPETSIDIIRRATSTMLDPRISPEDKKNKRLLNSRAIIDATKPFEWKEQYPKTVQPSLEYREESRKKFGYLFK